MGNTLSRYHETDHQLDLGAQGSIKGLQFDCKSRRYLGVPYALPPIGEHRWRKPRPLPSEHSYCGTDGKPFDATRFGPICSQALNYTSANNYINSDSVYNEDCLRLNIWTHVDYTGDGIRDAKKTWPVMLWLHGGWFQMGDPSHEIGMDPTEMISTGKLNAVVVAIGYRLNVFGFLAGTALQGESESVGNYGLWDQRLAIEWVQKYIHHFNGNASNITLAGRSAGAYSVHAHSLYEFRKPRRKNDALPFHRLVMISNAIPAQPKTPGECDEQFEELCTAFGMSKSRTAKEKLAILRAIDGDDLIHAITKMRNHTFRPVTDNEFILPQMDEYQRTGAFAREFKQRGFKLLIGEVLNEETLYAATNGPKEGSIDALRTEVGNHYAPATTDRVLQHYKMPEKGEKSLWSAIFGNIIADGQVRAPSRELTRSLVENGVSIRDVWRYRIAYRLSFIDETVAPKTFGVAHAMDKPFWKYVLCVLAACSSPTTLC